MATITRRLAYHLRAVCRRAFGSRGTLPNLCVTTSPDGLIVRAKSADVAVEYRGGTGGPPSCLWFPFQLLLDCEAKKDDPVQIEAAGKDRVAAQWQDGRVPQIVNYDVTEATEPDTFPAVPEKFAQNPISLLDAFEAAGDTIEAGAVRYATDCVQVCAKSGTLAATDGRQLLVQDGFTFPWDEDVLLPKTKPLACPEFQRDRPVEVGRAGNWLAFRVGEWTVWIALKEGRFPDFSRHIPLAADAMATCRFSLSDAAFLTATLPRLPVNDQENCPVTVDLNGKVAIRALAEGQTRPTEVVLTNSAWSGEQIRFNTNRQYLVRAAKLGLREMHLYGPEKAVFCEGDHRKYVWMVLSASSSIGPAADALRIESPADPAGAVTQPTKRRKSVPKTNHQPETANRNGQNPTAETKPEQPTGAIQQAVALRDSLRDAAGKASDLIRSLQQEKRHTRQLRSALASLGEIQKLGI